MVSMANVARGVAGTIHSSAISPLGIHRCRTTYKINATRGVIAPRAASPSNLV